MVPASISSRSSGLPPCRHSVANSASSRSASACSRTPNSAQRIVAAVVASSARSCQLASQWCMPGQAVRIVELRGDHRRHAQRDQVTAVFGGQGAQHPHQRQVGRRPRLVEPFLADRPAAVMGQPGQVRVQDEREEPGYRARGGRPGIEVTAVPRSRPDPGCRRCPVSAASEVEIIRRHRRDIGEQFGGPRRIGQCAGDLGVDDRAAVACVELGKPAAVKHAEHRLDREARTESAAR